MMENICICILNYNNGPATINCLKSILCQSFTNFCVIVVDNCSTDDSLQAISRFIQGRESSLLVDAIEPKIVIAVAPDNAGYAAGNNLGIKYAKESGCFSHILILNNDTELCPDFLEEMVIKFRSEEIKHKTDKIAIGSMETNQAGNLRNKGFHYLNIPSGLVFNFRLFPSFRYIIGSCIFLPVGTPIMDDRYFLYYDDIAFSKILIQNHYYFSTLSSTSYKHEMGGTTNKNPNLHRIIFQNMKKFYLQNYPLIFPLVILIRFLLNILLGRARIAIDLLRISLSPQETVHS